MHRHSNSRQNKIIKKPKYFFFTTVWGPVGCGLFHSVNMHSGGQDKSNVVTVKISSFKQGLGGAY